MNATDDDTVRLLRETFADAERLIPEDHLLPATPRTSPRRDRGPRTILIAAAAAAVAVIAVAASVLTAPGPLDQSGVAGTGSSQPPSGGPMGPPLSSASGGRTTGQQVAYPAWQAPVYAAVLVAVSKLDRPSGGWPGLLVLNAPYDGAGDPGRTPVRGTTFDDRTLGAIGLALKDVAPLSWMPDKASATDDDPTCPTAKNGGLVVTLGPVRQVGDHLEVGVNGWYACQGAHWQTYRLDRAGSGWRITGLVGPQAIS